MSITQLSMVAEETKPLRHAGHCSLAAHMPQRDEGALTATLFTRLSERWLESQAMYEIKQCMRSSVLPCAPSTFLLHS